MAGSASTQSLDSQIYAFAEVGKLERRIAEIEDLVATIKRQCLDGMRAALPEMVTSTSELRWHLRQVASHVFDIERHLGIKGRGKADVDQEPVADPKASSGLRGSTDTLHVPDLINLLSSLQKTGSLTLQAGDSLYVLEFLDGAIVHAVTNHRDPGLRLGTILEAQCKLTADQLRESLAVVERTKELLGTELVRTARVSESDLRGALELQVRRLFASIFALPHARFSFVESNISTLAQRVTLNTTQLLLETARRQDEERRTPDFLQRPTSPAAPAG